MMRQHTVVVTGTSGAAYGLRLVEQLLGVGGVDLVFTPSGARVASRELGLDLPSGAARESVTRFLELRPDLPLTVAIGEAAPASENVSAPHSATIVAPASAEFLQGLAWGGATSPVSRMVRSAMRMGRQMIVVPRQTPIDGVDLRALTMLADAGVRVVPASPALPRPPASVDDMVNHVVGVVLDVLGVAHDLAGGSR